MQYSSDLARHLALRPKVRSNRVDRPSQAVIGNDLNYHGDEVINVDPRKPLVSTSEATAHEKTKR